MKPCCPHRVHVKDGHQIFYWKGHPIKDIDHWVKAHHDVLVRYRHEVQQLDIFTGHEYLEIRTGFMPRSWLHNMRMTGTERYIELE